MNNRWQQLFEAVKYINEKFGADVINDLKRLKGLLMDLAPDCAKEMNTLLNILSEQVIIKSLTEVGQTDEGKIAEYIGDNFGFGDEWSSNLSKAAAFLAEKTVTEKTEEKTGKEKKVKVIVKEVPAEVSVHTVEEKPKEEKAESRKGNILSDEWIVSRADVMFQKLISHNEDTVSYIDEVASLVRSDSTLSDVISEIRKNYKDIYGVFESDFYLPGAMTVFLRKYSSSNGTSEYSDFYQRYCDYMNSIPEMEGGLPYYFVNVSSPLNENYYFDRVRRQILYSDAERERMICENIRAWNRTFFCDITEEEKREAEKARKKQEWIEKTPFRLIDTWSNPLGLFKIKDGAFSIVPQKSEPETVWGRYLFLADKFLNRNDRFNLACYCLKKAKEINPDPDSEFDRLLEKAFVKCSGTDNFETAWGTLINSFPENENIYLEYIKFQGVRICDNIDEKKKKYDKYYRNQIVPYHDSVLGELPEVVGEKSERIFCEIEIEINKKPESMRAALKAEVSRQMNLINKRYNEVYSYVENNIRETQAKKLWIPQKRCQHCGGEFKGAFKKVCSRCGKEKDYK